MSRRILINCDLEMPKCCYKCFAYIPSEYSCAITSRGLTDDYEIENGYNLFRQRHKNCPLELTDVEDV